MKNFLNLLTVSLPLFLGAVNPVFYMPLDDSADVIGPEGKTVAAGDVRGKAEYQPGRVGKALDVRRHAHDQVTTVKFQKMPAVDCNNGTVSFWFKPHWDETDSAKHVILNARDSRWKFRFYLLKNKDYIELSVCSPGQVQVLQKKDLLKAEEWAHVAFTWEQSTGTVRLFVNGSKIGEKILPDAFKHFEEPVSVIYFLGEEKSDPVKTIVGDGLYDEIKIFDKPLSEAEIAALASNDDQEKNSK